MPRIDLSNVEEARGFELERTGVGGRNHALFHYACSLQAKGVGDRELAAAVMAANAEKMDPPLPEWEVESVIRSATTRYAKGSGGGTLGRQAPVGYADDDPPKVTGEGHPELLPDMSHLKPWEQAQAWLDQCFFPDDIVCLTRDYTDVSSESQVNWFAGVLTGRAVPRLFANQVAWTLLSRVGDMGAWAVVNPLVSLDSRRADSEVGRMELGPDGKWVTRPAFHHVLVECDELPPEEQLERICALFLHGTPDRGRRPVLDAITWSGGKSYHAMVRCGGSSRHEHDDHVRWLYRYCDENGLPVDHKCGNPSRLTRLPGARRGESMQRLVWVRGL